MVSPIRKRVLLDVDGVLADFLTPCLAIVNELTGKTHTLDAMNQWDIFHALGCSKEVENEGYRRMKQPGWCRAIPVYDGAQAGVKELEKIADVYVVTSPMNGETWTHERERWLMAHFGIDRKRVIHGDAKYIVAGDVLVDDKINNVEKWMHHHPGGLGVVWQQVTNVHQKWHGLRAGDWRTLCTLVESHAPNRTWSH